MKKQLRNVLLVAVALFSAQQSHAADVAINATNFPDQTFRDYVSENFDTDGNGKLSDEERAAVTQIDLGNMEVSNLKGIENFKSTLTFLSVYGTSAKPVDLTQFVNLEHFNNDYCSTWGKVVNVSGLQNLREIILAGEVETLIAQNGNYENLGADNFQAYGLKHLDISGDQNVVEFVWPDGSSIEDINLSNCPNLTTVNVTNNSNLTSLDLSGCPVEHVDAGFCPSLESITWGNAESMKWLSVYGTGFKDLDVTALVNLEYLNNDCCTQCKTVNVSGLQNLREIILAGEVETLIAQNGNFENLGADQFQASGLKHLDISGDQNVVDFYWGNSSIEDINLSNCPNLTTVNVTDNSNLTSLDLSGCPIEHVDAGYCTSLESIVWGNAESMKWLSVYRTGFKDLDVTALVNLEYLNNDYCTQCKTVNVSGLQNLREIILAGEVETLIAQNGNYENLGADNFQAYGLKHLDISGDQNVVDFYWGNSSIEDINLSNCPNLTTVDVTGNGNLTSLDLSGCPVEHVDAGYCTSLESIIWGNAESMKWLSVYGTGFKDLDVTALVNLEYLNNDYCTQCKTVNVSGLQNLREIILAGEVETLIAQNGNYENLGANQFQASGLKHLDISGDQNVVNFYWGNSSIEDINVSNCPNLTTVDVTYNSNLTSLDLSGSTAITSLDVHSTSIAEFDLSEFVNLEYLNIDNSALWEHLDVSMMPNLRELSIGSHKLKYLNLESNTALETFNSGWQNPDFTLTLLSKNEVGVLVDDAFDVSKVSELIALEKNLEPKSVTVDGNKYLLVYDNAATASGQIEKNIQYHYATGKSDDYYDNLFVDGPVTEVIKCPSFLTLSKTAVSGTYGGSVAAPAVTRSQGYEGTLSYVSSNPAVVTVDASGKLTIVGAGTANITVSGVETDYRQAPEPVSYKVTIKKASPVLSFAQAAVEIEMLDEVPANALTKGVYDGVVNYASSNQAVATVNATTGEVTVIAAGTTTITASGAATANCNAPKAATYTLTVNKKTATITLAATTVSGTYGGTITAPKATATTGYDGKLTYKSSKATVVTVNANTGKLTIKGAGTATITVSGTETDVYKAPSSVTYTVTIAKASPVFSYEKDLVAVNNFTSLPVVDNKLEIGLYDGTVVYTSSDPTVATVDADGNVTCLKSGTTTITATGAATANCNGSSASFELVTDLIPTGVSTITVDFNDGHWYTPAGIRVDNPRKGQLYIHNGKKVIFK